MPAKKHLKGVGDKEQRQYEHIKKGARKEGRYGKRAKEVAARTVMKQHRDKGPLQGRVAPMEASAGPMAELGDFPEEVPTPVGSLCAECDRAIEEGDRGRIIEWETADRRRVAYHRDCFNEPASAGIGG